MPPALPPSERATHSRKPAGKNFHETATVSGLWHVLGHINGNALYNNWDPAFAEFVEYTKTRWGYTIDLPGKPTQTKYRFPYDVALWATIADFPYSWPLWQRFSEKFINSHLVSERGKEGAPVSPRFF